MKKQLKRIILAFMSTVLLCSTAFFTLNIGAESSLPEEALSCELMEVAEDFTWDVSDDGTLTISGHGAMPEFEESPWLPHITSIKKVVISEGITSISYAAFYVYYVYHEYGEYAIEEVILPDSLISIEDLAFADCAKLKSITIPENVSYMGPGVFYHCSSLTDVVVLGTLEYISDSTFYYCTSLESVTLPESVTYISGQAFFNCEALKKVIFKGDNIYIDYDAFEGCNLLTSAGGLNSGCNIEYGWTDAVYATGLRAFPCVTTLSIPEGVEEINENAFSFCYNLSEVSLPGTLEIVGDYSFSMCGLEKISLPYGVTTIGNNAFSNSEFENKDDSLPTAGLKSIFIPGSVTSIGDNAFENCNELVIICEPDSYAEAYAIENFITYELFNDNVMSVVAQDANGNTVSGAYTVNWYEKDSDEIIAVGKIFSGYSLDKEYVYEIVLGEELSYSYYPPEKKAAPITNSSQELRYTLDKIGTVTVSGSVKDENGAPVSNAVILCKQTFNGEYQKNVEAQTNANGEFSVLIKNVATTVRITTDGCYTMTKRAIDTKADGNTVNLGSTVMKKLPENKITLSVKRTSVRIPGQDPIETDLTSVEGISFTVTNKTKNKEITDYEIQFPSLIIGDMSVEGGDVIEICANDNNKKMTAAPTNVTLDSQRNGNAIISFTDNGYLSVTGITGSISNYAMIFDIEGKFVKSYSALLSFTSDALEDGNYTLLLIKKTNLLRRVADITKFGALGLNEGTDYVTRDFTIKTGEITEINGIYVPSFDESKLYYTVPDSTGFTANVPSAVIGKYVILRADYEIDPKYSSENETVTIEIPEGINFTAGSLTLNSKSAPYSVDGNTLTIITNSRQGVIRFYAVATKQGQHDINAYLSFDNEAGSFLQPIGTVSLEATANKINIPKRVSRTNFIVTGLAIPESTVTLYENGIVQATTTSNKNGKWSINAEISKPYSFSYHEFYAVFQKEGYDTITTDKEFVIYDKEQIEVSKVTFINQAHPEGNLTVTEYLTEINFLDPKPLKPYRYWPDYPKFTFKVEFTDNSKNELLSHVHVVTRGASDEIIKTPLTYDNVSGCWIGTNNFSSFDAPLKLGVDFSLKTENVREVTVDADMIADIASDIPEISPSDAEIFLSYFDIGIEENITDNEGNGTVVFKLTSDDDTAFLTYSSQIMEEFTNDGSFEEISLSDGNIYYSRQLTEPDYTLEEIYDTNSKTLVSIKLSFPPEQHGEDAQLFGFFEDLNELVKMIQYMTRWFSGSLDEVEENTNNLWQEFQTAKAQNPCFKLSMSKENIEQTAQREYNAINESLDSSYGQFLRTIEHISSLDFLFPEEVANAIGKITSRLQILITGELASLHAHMLLLAFQVERASWAGKPCDLPPDGGTPPPSFDGTPPPSFDTPLIQDPSGYVYEAVPSNRVEGVKAECYYYDYPLDEFGMPADNKEDIFWNAEEYDQVNPLYTDKNGMYAWDVPLGEWLVKFSKDGYYDTDSRNDTAANPNGYLPVPPPQTQVNTAIVSKASPKIESINVYTNEVQIVFTQYMQIDSVNTQNVKITCDGQYVSGEISPVNAEYDYAGENMYASVFAFTPDSVLSGNVDVEIKNVINYAGKAMQNAISLSQSAGTKPEGITISSDIEIDYNSGALIEIQITPAQAGANKTLTVSTLSPGIVGIVNNTVMTDENGKATVMLSGNLPGEGYISVSLDGTDMSITKKALVGNVVSTSNACAKVTSNIESGSSVIAGTQILLFTETEGAEIYYTLDGTCPCVENNPSRIKYTGAITADQDMFIIAYAVKNGMECSATAGFVYTVKNYIVGDLDGNGFVNSFDRTILSRYIARWDDYTEDSFIYEAADVTGDGVVNAFDRTALTRHIAKWPGYETLPCDI